jgi:hypothetical protein
MRVLVTGGRAFTTFEERMWLYDGLNLLHAKAGVTEIIEGGAKGADLAAKNWALWRKGCGDRITLTTVNADWERFGRGAGHIRNAEMAKLRPDVVLACPGGTGTASMIEIAKAHGLKVIYLEKMPVLKAKKRGDPAEPPPIEISVAA